MSKNPILRLNSEVFNDYIHQSINSETLTLREMSIPPGRPILDFGVKLMGLENHLDKPNGMINFIEEQPEIWENAYIYVHPNPRFNQRNYSSAPLLRDKPKDGDLFYKKKQLKDFSITIPVVIGENSGFSFFDASQGGNVVSISFLGETFNLFKRKPKCLFKGALCIKSGCNGRCRKFRAEDSAYGGVFRCQCEN